MLDRRRLLGPLTRDDEALARKDPGGVLDLLGVGLVDAGPLEAFTVRLLGEFPECVSALYRDDVAGCDGRYEEFPAGQDRPGIVEGGPVGHLATSVEFSDLSPLLTRAQVLLGDRPERVAAFDRDAGRGSPRGRSRRCRGGRDLSCQGWRRSWIGCGGISVPD